MQSPEKVETMKRLRIPVVEFNGNHYGNGTLDTMILCIILFWNKPELLFSEKMKRTVAFGVRSNILCDCFVFNLDG